MNHDIRLLDNIVRLCMRTASCNLKQMSSKNVLYAHTRDIFACIVFSSLNLSILPNMHTFTMGQKRSLGDFQQLIIHIYVHTWIHLTHVTFECIGFA